LLSRADGDADAVRDELRTYSMQQSGGSPRRAGPGRNRVSEERPALGGGCPVV
jgi:hypothetical protein